MRLICPQCDAQYEISAEMIPPEGRDVQCSNCATTWFQPGADTGADDAPVTGSDEASDTAPDGAADGAPGEGADTLEAIADEEADHGDGAAIDPDFVPAPDPTRRGPDARVIEILREEREFNRRAAAAERGERAPEGEAPGADEGGAAGPEAAAEPAEAEAEKSDAEVQEAESPEAEARRERERMAAAAALARARDAAEDMEADRASDDPDAAPAGPDGADGGGDGDGSAAPEAGGAPTDDAATAPPVRERRSKLGDRLALGAAEGAAEDRPDPRLAAAAAAASTGSVDPETAARADAVRRRARRAQQLPQIEAVEPADPPPASDPLADLPVASERRAGGFRLGVAVALLAVAVAAAVYVWAPRLAQSVPALAEGLLGYRAAVDGARADLAVAVDGLTERLNAAE